MSGRAQRIAQSKIVLALAAFVLPGALVGVVAIDHFTADDPSPISRGASDGPGGTQTSFLARLIPAPPVPPASGPRVARSVSDLAKRMSVERKVAQLFLLGFQGQDLTAPIFERLRIRDLGGVVVDDSNYADSSQLAGLAGEAGVIAEQANHVPPWVLAPQEGGRFNAFPDLPPATAAADLRSNVQAFDEAKQAAETLRGLGISGVLSPVVDVAPPESIALGERAYSDDPDEVAAYARAVVDAYRDARVLTAAGHFPGLGLGSEDTRLGVSQVASSLGQLRRRDLVPFRAAIRAGVPAIMMSNGLYVTDDFVTPASLSRAVTTDLLRRDLRFAGVAITDDLADPSITAVTSIPDAALTAVKAGADLLYVSGPEQEQEAAYDLVLRAARSGEITKQRLDEAILRGLAVKRDYGLID